MINFPVSEGKASDLVRRMGSLNLREEDIEESYYRPCGKGAKGRALTGVMLVHKSTGVRIRCNRESSQGINRFLARRTLVEELEARQQHKTRHEVKAEKLRAEKLRRKGSRRRTQQINPFGMSPGELAFARSQQQEEEATRQKLGMPSAHPGRTSQGGGNPGAQQRAASSGSFDLAQAQRGFILRMPAQGLPML